MVEGVLLVDLGGRIRLVNQALKDQFHLVDDAVGKTVMEVFRNIQLHNAVLQALSGKQVHGQELTFFDSQEHVFDVNAAGLRTEDSLYMGAVVVFHNITRLKQLENMRKEFVANVSHELRTPLSIIKGYVETLLGEHSPDEQTAQQFLRTVQKHSARLETLINDLLTISALESQRAHLALEFISLHAIVKIAIEELTQQAQAKSITISLKIPESFPKVKADAQRLYQVFVNLLDNAIKYIQRGGHVVVSSKEHEEEMEVCVADDGPGIAPEHLSHLFERFYRVDKARSREVGGTGLGLSIVKHIVQAHGGRVKAENKSDGGSAFYFTLPTFSQVQEKVTS